MVATHPVSRAPSGRRLSYVDQHQAPLAARSAALRSSAATGNPTPGAYMRDRRRAAGISRADVAARIAGHYGARADIECALADLERDRPGNHAALVGTLKAHNAFPFNMAMFAALAAATCAPSLGEWEPA